MSFLFMERTPPRLVVLPIGALTFASVGVWFGISWLLIAYGQDLLGTVGLRLLTLRLVLGFLGLLVLLFATFARLSRGIVLPIDGVVPLDCLRSSRIPIGHLKEFGDSGRRIQSDVLRYPSTADSLLKGYDNR